MKSCVQLGSRLQDESPLDPRTTRTIFLAHLISCQPFVLKTRLVKTFVANSTGSSYSEFPPDQSSARPWEAAPP